MVFLVVLGVVWVVLEVVLEQVEAVAKPLLLPVLKKHPQDHPNHYQGHQNHHQDHPNHQAFTKHLLFWSLSCLESCGRLLGKIPTKSRPNPRERVRVMTKKTKGLGGFMTKTNIKLINKEIH